MGEQISITTQGEVVEFYWAGVGAYESDVHVKAAVDALVCAAEGETGRLTNPFTRAAAKAEFKKRIQRLMKGNLYPVDEVKPVQALSARLYEVRWQNINAHELGADNQRYPVVLLIRMIFAEPAQLGHAALGLHAHEKDVQGKRQVEIKRDQNAQIECAVQKYLSGESTSWGVTPRD